MGDCILDGFLRFTLINSSAPRFAQDKNGMSYLTYLSFHQKVVLQFIH